MEIVLDTCAVIWLALGTNDLSVAAKRLAEHADTTVLVSPVSCGEIACACERKRLKLDRHWKPWLRQVLDDNGWTVAMIDMETVEEAYSLPGTFHADPADRLIVATARLRDCAVITGDRKILDYPHVKSLA